MNINKPQNNRWYLTYSDIQQHLTEQYQATGKKINYLHAVKDLHAAGKSFQRRYSAPNCETWDITQPTSLLELYGKTPIDITVSVVSPDTYNHTLNEEISFFTNESSSVRLMFRNAEPMLHAFSFFDIVYVISGSCELTLESEKRILNKGEVCIMAPELLHDAHPVDSESVGMNILLRKSTFENTFFNTLKNDNILSAFFYNGLYNSSKKYLLFNAPLTRKIAFVIKNIIMESAGDKNYSNDVSNAYISILFYEILRNYDNIYEYFNPADNTNDKILVILMYIKKNYKRTSLNQLADVFGYDAAYLGKLIHKTTGMYYNDIINKYKIDRAKQLLVNAELSIAEIADIAGFNSADHFGRIFKKIVGCSPSEYRK